MLFQARRIFSFFFVFPPSFSSRMAFGSVLGVAIKYWGRHMDGDKPSPHTRGVRLQKQKTKTKTKQISLPFLSPPKITNLEVASNREQTGSTALLRRACYKTVIRGRSVWMSESKRNDDTINERKGGAAAEEEVSLWRDHTGEGRRRRDDCMCVWVWMDVWVCYISLPWSGLVWSGLVWSGLV